jgi:hypothetical protein
MEVTSSSAQGRLLPRKFSIEILIALFDKTDFCHLEYATQSYLGMYTLKPQEEEKKRILSLGKARMHIK